MCFYFEPPQHNTNEVFKGYDHNVLPVWEQGVTGKGVVVSILDDGECSCQPTFQIRLTFKFLYLYHVVGKNGN